jgi:WD40 repeat protein
MDFSPDGRRLATASDDRWARVLALDSCGGGAESVDLVGHTDSVRGVRFSADGRRLVTASMDGTARVWGPEGKEIAVLRDHSNRVYHAEFGAADRLILTASRDGAVRVWETPPPGGDAQPTALLVYTAELGGIPHAAFSPEGRYVAAGYWRNAAMVWRLIEPPGGPPEAHLQPSAAAPAPIRDLAVLEEARRFRRQNRIDDLLDVSRRGR